MKKPLKLAIIGDPHLAVPQGEADPLLDIDPGRKLHAMSVELLEAVVAAVNSEAEVSAVLVLGDMTRDSEDFNHKRAKEVLSQLRAPVFMLLGNHDLGLDRAGHEEIIYPGARRLDREAVVQFYADAGFPGGRPYYSVDLDSDVRLVALDSTLSNEDRQQSSIADLGHDDGWIEPAQVTWLEAELQAAREAGKLPLLAMHHSCMDQSPAERPGHALYRTLRFWQLRNAAELNSLLLKFDVPLVLSGHLHAQCVNAQDSLVNLVTSSTVGYPHAWRVLTFAPDAIRVETRLVTQIPGCQDLQEQSRRWVAEGMTSIILAKLKELGPLARHADEIGRMVTASGWWPRFCDGSLRGFKVDPALVPRGDFVSNMLTKQVVQILDSFGNWQDTRPDPVDLLIPLEREARRGLFSRPRH